MSKPMRLIFLGFIFFYALLLGSVGQANSDCAPGWQGKVLIGGDSLQNWAVESDTGSSGGLQLAEGLTGQAVQLNWNIGSGNWVQAQYVFPQPVDLSGADLFGISLHGGPDQAANTVAVMFADVNNVFYGYDMPGYDNGINQINRWLINLALPKQVFYYFFTTGTANGGTEIDWSRINRVFVVIKRPGTGLGGGSGRIGIDQLQYDTAANWPRQTVFDTTHADTVSHQVAQSAVNYLLASQAATGLFISWQEEPSQKAHLYDQALVLIALTREGQWQQGQPANDAAHAAQRLVVFMKQAQKNDGHWARTWNPDTGEELLDDGWVGDQAWWVMALSSYAARSGDATARTSAQNGAAWLAAHIDAGGKVVASTEGNVDVWWAMMATDRLAEADRIESYLLDEATVWDADMRYWWRGYQDPVVAMDAATWLSAFSRHSRVNQPERGLTALSFVRRTLVTLSDDGTRCGMDGMGPVSVWNEGTAQYVAADGADGKFFLDTLLAQQNPDGSMPGSPDDWTSDTFGWLSPWGGLAPTTWLYFAVKGVPFPVARDFVSFLYSQFYARPGESEGLDYWAGEIESDALTPAQMVEVFFSAPEFQEIVAPIARLYFAAFDRIPDAEGLNYWVKVYRDGATLEQIGTGFVNSDEFKEVCGANLSDEEFVACLYQHVLKRPPDAPGLAFWLNALQQGMSRGAALVAFSESPENRSNTEASIQVTLLYEGLLGRPPTQDELRDGIATPLVTLIDILLASSDYKGPPMP